MLSKKSVRFDWEEGVLMGFVHNDILQAPIACIIGVPQHLTPRGAVLFVEELAECFGYDYEADFYDEGVFHFF